MMDGDGKEKRKRMMNEMMNNMTINTDECFEQNDSGKETALQMEGSQLQGDEGMK